MWSKIMRKRSVWAKLPHTTFVDRARNYVTQRAENWNRFNSSSATFRFKLRSATLVANSGSAERSTTGSVSNRSAEGNGRPTSAAMCRTKGATCRQAVRPDRRTLARFWVLIRIYCWAGLVRDEYIGFEGCFGPALQRARGCHD